jgi:signal transduction histidine kinase/HD-like signal output (HDOD) protein/CheY-like chemotaxis protein
MPEKGGNNLSTHQEMMQSRNGRNGGIARQEIKRILKSLDNLPTLPAVATSVLNLTLDDEANTNRLVRLIESDQSLTLKILKLVNSASFGLAHRVTNVGQALIYLGISALQCALLSISVYDCFLKDPKANGTRHKELWKHALACAVSSEMIAEKTYPQIKPEAFAAGLLHDIGYVVLQTYLPAEFEKIQRERQMGEADSLALEQELLSLDHTLIGKWLAQRWNLPQDLVDVIWLHHHPYESLASLGVNQELIGVVMLADRLVHETLIDRPVSYLLESQYTNLLNALSLSKDEVDGIKAQMGKRFAERAEVFNLESDEAYFYYEALQRANSKLGSLSLELNNKSLLLGETNRILSVTNEMGVKLARARDSKTVVDSAVEILRNRMGIQQGAVYRIDWDNYLLEGKIWYGQNGSRYMHYSLDRKEKSVLDSKDQKLPDTFKKIIFGYRNRIPTLAPQENGSSQIRYQQPYVFVPLIAQDQFIGELCLMHPEGEGGGRITPQQYLGYVQIGTLVAAAFDRVRLFEHLDMKTEELSTALWKSQQMNLQLMQTERLAAVGQLAAGAAHEINNPLAVIYARAQLMQFKEQDEKRREELKQIAEQIERISSILVNLMNFARPAPPKIQPLSLNRLLEKTVALVQGGMKAQHITIQTHYDEALPTIKGDPNQLEQVFLNLFINAQHAMEKSGGTLTITTGTREEGKKVVVTVADQGVGISKENLPKIFDPFFTTKEAGKGTGLGLSTSYGIVNNHYGSIQVQSQEGVGTRVTVELPVDLEALRPEKAPRVPARKVFRRDKTPRVLVVDDEKDIRSVLKEALEAEGLEVDTAVNGQEGLEKLAAKEYNLLLLDIKMPVRGGLSLLSEIRDRIKGMPVIVITGMATPEELEEAFAMGAFKCMRKPFHIKSLIRDIHEALEKGSANLYQASQPG